MPESDVYRRNRVNVLFRVSEESAEKGKLTEKMNEITNRSYHERKLTDDTKFYRFLEKYAVLKLMMNFWNVGAYNLRLIFSNGHFQKYCLLVPAYLLKVPNIKTYISYTSEFKFISLSN